MLKKLTSAGLGFYNTYNMQNIGKYKNVYVYISLYFYICESVTESMRSGGHGMPFNLS